MNTVPMRSSSPINRDNILSLNEKKIAAPLSYQNLDMLNRPMNTVQSDQYAQSAQNYQTDQYVPPVQNYQTNQYTPPVQNYQTNQYTPPLQNYQTSQYTPPVQNPANNYNVTTDYNMPTSRNAEPTPVLRDKAVPPLMHTTQKGQKVALMPSGPVSTIKACLGWNVSNAACDLDVSAFLLDNSGKIIGDDWFVFYGQECSPDQSTRFKVDDSEDREVISIDFQRLNPQVSKIVFVLTINEAFEKNLNFSMVKDAYVRILNGSDNSEIVSFMMDEYYSNVTSMMIGEVYKYKDSWKFNAIGNGVSKDLAGLCEMYGVQVV